MVVAAKLAMFAACLVVALVAGWLLGHLLSPTLTLEPPGAPALPHTTHTVQENS